MILSYNDFKINESFSIKEIKKTIRGVLSKTDRIRFKKLLRNNIVKFKYIKRDDSVRYAKGTLISKYLPALRGGAPKPEHQFVYYDFDKHHWRSFRTFKFIKIIDIISSDSEKSKKSEKTEHIKDEHKDSHDDIKKKDIDKHDIDVDKTEEDERKKTFKAGDKMSEKELLRRSVDLRKGSKKNKTTKEANDKFKSGELYDKHKDKHSEETEEKNKKEDE